MKRLLGIILSVVLLGALCMSAIGAEAKTKPKQVYTVSGVIEGVAGEPVPNAIVTATIRGVKIKAKADVDGAYSIGLSAGTYTLVASGAGFRNFSQVIIVDGNKTVNFTRNMGLIPQAPDEAYVWVCIARWKSGEINLSKVLAVINAWKFPR